MLIYGHQISKSISGLGLTLSNGSLSVLLSDYFTYSNGHITINDNKFILQNGNSFNATASIGTNDNQNLVFKTNNIDRVDISKNGVITLKNTYIHDTNLDFSETKLQTSITTTSSTPSAIWSYNTSVTEQLGIKAKIVGKNISTNESLYASVHSFAKFDTYVSNYVNNYFDDVSNVDYPIVELFRNNNNTDVYTYITNSTYHIQVVGASNSTWDWKSSIEYVKILN